MIYQILTCLLKEQNYLFLKFQDTISFISMLIFSNRIVKGFGEGDKLPFGMVPKGVLGLLGLLT